MCSPRRPTLPLLEYGASFADFIAGFEPAASLPYLPDVARIERAWVEAYHAAEATPIGAQELAPIPADQLADIQLSLHPSLSIVRSRFPALTIWRMNVDDGVPKPVDFTISEDTLVVRPRAAVEVRSMPPGGAEFIAALVAGHSLGEAAGTAAKANGRFDFKTNLRELIGAGVFVGYRVMDGSTNREEVSAA